MPDEPQLRCFIALDLPEPIRAEAERVQLELQELNLFKGRYTAPDNIHLTLKFLGSIPLSTVEAVKSELMNIHLNAPTIRVISAGMFAPRIVWVKLEGADKLQGVVDSTLENYFKPETRFMGHLTIARVKSTSDPKTLAHAVEDLHVKRIEGQSVSFSLQQSMLQPKGPKYVTLQRYKLGTGQMSQPHPTPPAADD